MISVYLLLDCKVPYVFFEVRKAFKNVVKNKKETVAFHNATVL